MLASGIFITAFFHALKIFNSITVFTRNATLREGYKGRRKAGLLPLINILRFFVHYATCVGITKASVKYYLDFPACSWSNPSFANVNISFEIESNVIKFVGGRQQN